jgi:glycosyltransferase involved in cell wall biosynthesis
LPAVSVVIPTYQRRALVTRAVASVLRQTFGDFELIVVDGSDDGTKEALAGLDPRLRYVWQENRGVAATRNAGIRLARGDVVAFLDSDNQWLPDHLEVITDVLERHPQAVLVSTCPSFHVAGSESPSDAREVDLLPDSVLRNCAGFVSCIAVRREPLQEIGGFDEELPVAEDNDLWLRLAMRGPFATVQRRTIVQQTTRGGLRERGRQTGAYVDAIDRYLTRAVGELAALPGRDTTRMVASARGVLAVNAAVRALIADDEDAARAALQDAHHVAPELSGNPGPVMQRALSSSTDRQTVSRRLAAIAALWPEQRSDTARFLRGYAAVLALRDRHLLRAGRLFVSPPSLLDPGFVRRSTPRVLRIVRRVLHESRNRGHEPAETVSRP